MKILRLFDQDDNLVATANNFDIILHKHANACSGSLPGWSIEIYDLQVKNDININVYYKLKCVINIEDEKIQGDVYTCSDYEKNNAIIFTGAGELLKQ